MRPDLVKQHWDEISGSAGVQARESMRQQILAEELNQYKESLQREYQTELRAQMRKKIEEEVEAVYKKKMNDFFGR